LAKIPSVEDPTWKTIKDAGWDGESLRLKGDLLASTTKKGALGTVFKYVNSALGSLIKAFPVLEPVKQFKEFMEPFFGKVSEPVPFQAGIICHRRDPHSFATLTSLA